MIWCGVWVTGLCVVLGVLAAAGWLKHHEACKPSEEDHDGA